MFYKHTFLYYTLILSSFATACNNKKEATVDSDFKNELLPYAVIEEGDTVFTETYNLKKGYTLCLHPVATAALDEDWEYEISAILIGPNSDTLELGYSSIYEKNGRWTYDNIDFDNSFALSYRGGGNYSSRIILYDKTSKQSISSEKLFVDYNPENELLLYYDEDKKLCILYNGSTGKTQDIECFECSDNPYSWASYSINKVTPEDVMIRFGGCENYAETEITLKRM